MANKIRLSQEEEIVRILKKEDFKRVPKKELEHEPYKTIYQMPDCFKSKK
jgi:hypothetical protein